ncbi:hypothetical protein AU255_14995 [Methyloprofundus sedimenti]|uniref:Urea ABC transporter permease n=1 Tax=Methyloprofundus sedimenti TaxID=1420851 RepID=A0A1V8M1X7_9GAMM|nr:urea ABC transporter permease subunit UrtB [Methyloprofundus sedimenti]OQK15532.1 hypothetical protein AU255_14995 [Methyloprofundus sedimenti]
MKFNDSLGRIGLFFLLLIMPLVGFSQDVMLATEENSVLPTYTEALSAIKTSSLSQRGIAIEIFAKFTKNPQTVLILQALMDGKLMELKADGQIVIAENNDGRYAIFAAETQASLGSVEAAAIKKINLTNRLRRQLRSLIAQVQLNSDDVAIRLQAVKEMAKNPTSETLVLLTNLYEKETNPDIQETIGLVFALQDMDSPDQALRLAAIESLKYKTSLEALNRLKALDAQDAEGNYIEPDKEVRKLARSAVAKIESRLQLYATAETLFFGLSLGAVLVLAAIGLAITFGVMGVINMAHGELMMLGAYTTYVMQQIMPNDLGLALLLSVPASFMVSGIIGIGIERGIIRYLYGRPLETLLATFGVSLFLQQTVRSVFSPLNKSVSTPEFMSGSWQINDFLSFTWNRMYILIFCFMVFAMLLQILRRTRLGLEVRAVSQNRNMAKAMGIPTDRVDAMTFGLGSGVAGIAGVALSQITNVGPNLGQAYIVDSFMVVVFGGVGNLWGTLVAGFTLGIANKVLEPYAGAVLAKILVLVFIILFIQKKPRGLFPQKGRAAES